MCSTPKIKKIKENMITRKNKKNRTAFVYDSDGAVESFVSQTYKNARQGSRLTIRSQTDRVDLNGRQIKALKKVLSTASRLASRK